MGLYASADLVFGIPIKAYDEDTSEYGFWWDEEEDYWRDIPAEHMDNLYIVEAGHYEAFESDRVAILTSPRINRWSADAFEPVPVEPGDSSLYNDKALSKAEESLRALGAPESFYGQARWYLTASYG
jgi:hypothetical protein